MRLFEGLDVLVGKVRNDLHIHTVAWDDVADAAKELEEAVG